MDPVAPPRERVSVLVDPAPLTRAWTCRVLESLGDTVRVAGDGDAAMALVPELDPDVVVIEERDAGGGAGLAAALRARGATAGIVVIGHDDAPDAGTDALQAGADAVLLRPCDARSVRRAVAEASGRGDARRRRRDREHELDGEVRAAALIQAALLPDVPPVPPGWALETAFLPARDVGGDLFDVVPAPEGGLVLVLADVSGKGVGAALLAAMAQTSLRGSIARGEGPGEALGTANALLLGTLERAGRFLTAFVAHIDLETGEFRYADAGHGHQLVVAGDGRVRDLDVGGPPLGFTEEAAYPEGRGALGPGETLAAFSDGLVEGDGEVADRRAALAAAVVHGRAAASLVVASPDDDDRTMVVLRRASGDDLRIDAPADPEGVQRVARAVAALVEGAAPDAAFACELAVTEACANVAEHAYPDRDDGRMRVRARRRHGRLVVAVRDDGVRFPPETDPDMPVAEAEGGRGLALLDALMDRVVRRRVDGENHLILARRLDGGSAP